MRPTKKLRLLCAQSDRAALSPVLEALRAKGLRVSEEGGEPGRNDIVLAVLSGNFYADSDKTDALLGLIGAGAENVLPVQIDGTPIPDVIKNALYARNIIPAAGREAAQIAERIAAALPQKKPRLGLILGAAGIVLLSVIGLFLWRAAQNREAVPAMADTTEESYSIPAGWTAEELEKIVDVIIVGEQVEFYTLDDFANVTDYPDWDYFAYRDCYDDEAHWFSREDGHEYSLTRYEDLRFLELMPNLRYLTLAKMETGQLPELSKLTRLDHLMLMDSVIPDLEWLRGSSFTNGSINNTTGSITDFSALTSCEKLRRINIELSGTAAADFSGFCPPALQQLQIVNGQDLQGAPDLSALTACTKLRECQLNQLPVTELSFLREASGLEILRLENLHSLRDISALRGMKRLRELYLEDCNQLRDLSPVAECTALESFSVACDGADPLRDVSFLGGLPQLKNINLGGVELANLDFLVSLSASRQSLDSFGFWGSIADYSGLSAIKRYNAMSLDPDDGVSLDAILPYLEDASIQDLCLRRFNAVDLSALPKPGNRLELDRCGIEDLSTMPEDWTALRLNLNKCSRLRSLDGLQNQSRIGRGFGDLEIYRCPRLTDWSALEGMKFASLRITGGFTLPDFEQMRVGLLRLDSVADVSDLRFLDGLDATGSTSFELVGLDELSDLSLLRGFRGTYLAVPPQLMEQAEDLVKAGNFHEYRIEYPQGGWEQDESDFALLSLDELETLPPALLRRVTSLCIAGDQIVDTQRYEICEDWTRKDAYGNPVLSLRDRATDEESPIGSGLVTDMRMFSALTGLRRIELWGQSLETLDGIQNLAELESFTAQFCPKLTDASALFSLQSLSAVVLEGTQISSVQGVQNLRELTWLDISNTEVTDLSPLAECDFSAACERGGLNLYLNGLALSESDFSALGTVRRFGNLTFDDADGAVWIGALADCEIEGLGAANVFRRNEDLAAFAADHPELRYLSLRFNYDLTDLSCLVPMENLERVSVSPEMAEAIASLDGQEYRFELEIGN